MQMFQLPFHKNSMYLSILSLNNIYLRESKLNKILSYFQGFYVHLETGKCAGLKAVFDVWALDEALCIEEELT